MRNVLVMGGFAESRRLLEPVADEAVKQRYGHDAEVLTLRQALGMDYERLRNLMAGNSVITHSAALIAVPDARQRLRDSELPEELTIVASPEPRSVGQLMTAAARKTLGHIFNKNAGLRLAYARVAASNAAEVMAHPLTNSSMLPEISRFSARGKISTGEIAAESRLGYFLMSDDEFYADPNWRHSGLLSSLISHGHTVAELFGNHDELLVDPYGVLRDVTKAQFSQGYDTAADFQNPLHG